MVAACPLGDGSSVSGCALRTPGCSNRESGRRGWPGGCGSARSRPTSGGAGGGPVGTRRWRPKGRAGRSAGSTPISWSGCAVSWPGPGGTRLGRPTVDPRPDHAADRPAVPHPLHPARHLIPVTPHRIVPTGTGPPRRRTRRGEDRHVADRDVGEGTRLAAATKAWIVFEDESGQSLRPPKARTWAPRGQTPVVRVSGKGSGRVSVAGLVCLKPGQRGRFFYRLRLHRGRKGERRSLSEDDYAGLIAAAHHQLHAPIILIWDNLNTHTSAEMRRFLDAHPAWLTVVRLPAYASDLNPTE